MLKELLRLKPEHSLKPQFLHAKLSFAESLSGFSNFKCDLIRILAKRWHAIPGR
jgi:hypothetical protein